MKAVKLLFLALLYFVTIPLISLALAVFNVTMSLWQWLARKTTEVRGSHREVYNRAVNELSDLVDTYKI